VTGTARDTGDSLAEMLLTHDAAAFERCVDSRVEGLSSADAAVRWRSALVLGAVGGRLDESAIGPIVATLDDPDAAARIAAGHALVAIGAPAAPWLVNALHDPAVRDLALSVLERIGDPAVAALAASLGEEDAAARWAAGAALEDLGDARAVEALVAALAHDDRLARECAMSALVDIGARAVAPLAVAAGSRDAAVRASAAAALGEIGDQRAFMPLVAALGDPDAGVRGAAAQALGDLGDPRAFAPLLLALGDDAAPARIGACAGLSRLGDERATWPLVEALTDDGSEAVRCAAAVALGEIGAPHAVEPLVEAVCGDASAEVRHGAAQALGEIGEPAVAPLLRVLDHGDEDARAWAATALESVGTPAIERLVADRDEIALGAQGPTPESRQRMAAADADFRAAMQEAYEDWARVSATGSSADRFLEADERARLLARFVDAARTWAASQTGSPLATARAVEVLLDAFDEAVGHPRFDRLIEELEAVYVSAGTSVPETPTPPAG
jgi:HEAT repeat protein